MPAWCYPREKFAYNLKWAVYVYTRKRHWLWMATRTHLFSTKSLVQALSRRCAMPCVKRPIAANPVEMNVVASNTPLNTNSPICRDALLFCWEYSTLWKKTATQRMNESAMHEGSLLTRIHVSVDGFIINENMHSVDSVEQRALMHCIGLHSCILLC